MKRKDFDFGEALKGYLGALENYWDSVRDAHLAINAFAKCHKFSCADDCSDSRYTANREGHIVLTYYNGCRDCTINASFAWYTMQSGRKEITAYVAL